MTKKLRIRKCKSVLVVPAGSDTQEKGSRYVCSREQHEIVQNDQETWHYETGVVEGPYGTGQEYIIKWRSTGYVTLRRRSSV